MAQRRAACCCPCRLRAQGMVLQVLASSQMGDIVPLVATPDSAGRLLGQVLAEAFQVGQLGELDTWERGKSAEAAAAAK